MIPRHLHGRGSKQRGATRHRHGRVHSSAGRNFWRQQSLNDTSKDLGIELEDMYSSLFGTGVEKEMGEELVEKIRNLPGTKDYFEYVMRVASARRWKRSLEKGILPHDDEVTWPTEPFRSKFAETLQKLEMLGFTRRYPKLTKSLLGQMVQLAHKFEEKMLEMENESSAKNESPDGSRTSQTIDSAQAQNGTSGEQEAQGDTQPSENEAGEPQEIEVELQPGEQESNGNDADDSTELKETQAEMERIAEELVQEFEEEMEPVMDNLKTARDMFQDLDDLVDKDRGFDYSSGVWQRSGWREMERLRKKLEDLKELRDLVRALGRSGGRGPKRKAHAQDYKTNNPLGVIRSSLQPEETSGLSRSGDLSRMLPSEAALLAAGWPKNGLDGGINDKHERLRKAARRLHLVRRAERNLFSYERTGWLENEPSRVLPHMEYRPAAEQGPIIICLDTSGSMHGARETVAKAVVLECLRGAHKQQRSCYLYAFSSYSDIRELELSTDLRSLNKLLDFLEHSFQGGTDVTRALELSLDRVNQKKWSQADILIVTDGEMGVPSQRVLDEIEHMQESLGLETHGLLVGNSESYSMQKICSQLHVFKSWKAVTSDRRR